MSEDSPETLTPPLSLSLSLTLTLTLTVTPPPAPAPPTPPVRSIEGFSTSRVYLRYISTRSARSLREICARSPLHLRYISQVRIIEGFSTEYDLVLMDINMPGQG